MHQILYKYLILNKQLSLPEVGTFFLDEIPAQLDIPNNLIHAPSSMVRYKPGLAKADKHFFNFIAKELTIDETEAIQAFHDFMLKAKQGMSGEHGFVIKGLGSIKKDHHGKTIFLAERQSHDLLPQVSLEGLFARPKQMETLAKKEDDNPDKLDKEVETMVQKELEKDEEDYWWIYAIILLLLGVGALLYYYV